MTEATEPEEATASEPAETAPTAAEPDAPAPSQPQREPREMHAGDDPYDHTVAEVQAYLDRASLTERDRVIVAEQFGTPANDGTGEVRGGKQRVGVLERFSDDEAGVQVVLRHHWEDPADNAHYPPGKTVRLSRDDAEALVWSHRARWPED